MSYKAGLHATRLVIPQKPGSLEAQRALREEFVTVESVRGRLSRSLRAAVIEIPEALSSVRDKHLAAAMQRCTMR
jgi:hypothetical protein